MGLPPKTDSNSAEIDQNPAAPPDAEEWIKQICPLCGQRLLQEKCKVVCRSPICGYRIVYNCSEF